MTGKNILIAIDSGIVGLDIQKQLNRSGYNAEIINLSRKDGLKKQLEKHFQLMILEKYRDNEGLEYALQLADEYNLPVIYLSTDNYFKKNEGDRYKVLIMPFDGEDLKKKVKTALGEL